MKRRFTAIALALILAPLGPALAATGDGDALQFISSLGHQALAVVRSDLAPDQKLAYFHKLLIRDFDMPEISRFVLGPYWRTAGPAERQTFMQLLSNDLERFYRDRLTRYEGESFQVTGSRTDPAGLIVTSRILRPNGAPIEVDWQLSAQSGAYKISDVIVDGVSMALTEREVLARQIQSSGGQVAGLIARIQAGAGVVRGLP